MKITALIMAGGRGERFWPKSRKDMPKQFLSLTGDGKTMIQHTVMRILPFVDKEDIFISTNTEYKSLVMEQLPDIPKENILCEPVSRNTAPCIGLGAIHMQKKYKDSIMVVLPSDHLVKYDSMFLTTLKDAVKIALLDSHLVTIGITPDYPETGYGYIKFNPKHCVGRGFLVDCFVEKPSIKNAKEYIASDEYLWNSGIFVWKVSSILAKFKELTPSLYEGLENIKNKLYSEDEEFTLEKEYKQFPSISIDYAILEKSNNIYTVPGTFGWDDVGSWLAVERIKTTNEFGNIVDGNVITIDSNDCIIEAGNKLIATIGIEDLIIVDTQDATLVCKKHSAGDIKKVLENLKICNRVEYL